MNQFSIVNIILVIILLITTIFVINKIFKYFVKNINMKK